MNEFDTVNTVDDLLKKVNSENTFDGQVKSIMNVVNRYDPDVCIDVAITILKNLHEFHEQVAHELPDKKVANLWATDAAYINSAIMLIEDIKL